VDQLLLLGAGLLAGLVGSVASLASLVSYPALLLATPSRGFEYVAPVLIAAGSVLMFVPRPAGEAVTPAGWPSRLAVLAVAAYIGYFGAAGGIVLLAVLIRVLAEPLARVNAVKNVVGGAANVVAGIGFAVFGPVRWVAVPALAAGFLAGGWIGPKIVRRLPAAGLRVAIGCCGLALAIRLGFSAY
jgi:uncharacterized membrane protein YfcA